jgi:hypothetical protein
MAFRTAFIKTMRPPKLTYLFPHDPSLLRTTFIIGSQVDNFLGLAPTGRPRYLKGTVPTLQLRKFEAIPRKSFDTFMPITQLFQKLTFKPETISKPLSTAFKIHKLSTVASPMQRVSSAY